MKHILTFSLFLIMIFNCSAQQIKPLESCWGGNNPAKNTYYKDVNNTLQKFIGTWIYSDANIYLRIRFYKVENIAFGPAPYFHTIKFDILSSYIEYKVKENAIWITKYNTFPTGGMSPTPIGTFPLQTYVDLPSIHGNYISSDELISLDYNEPTTSCRRFKRASLDLKYITSGAIPQLDWKRKPFTDNYEEQNVPCLDGQMIDMSNFIIPHSLVLTRQL